MYENLKNLGKGRGVTIYQVFNDLKYDYKWPTLA